MPEEPFSVLLYKQNKRTFYVMLPKSGLTSVFVRVTRPQLSSLPNKTHNSIYLRNKLVSSWAELRIDTGLPCRGRNAHCINMCGETSGHREQESWHLTLPRWHRLPRRDLPGPAQGGSSDTTWLQNEDPSWLESSPAKEKQRLCFGTLDLCILGSTLYL